MNKTSEQFENEIKKCRQVFAMKAQDYGTSWRILRLPSLTDQIFIKANRIRSIQMTGINEVEEGIVPEFIAIVNYSVIALIQTELGIEGEQNLPFDTAMNLYDKHINFTKDLMLKKNHDYGEAWRQMRVSSMVDIILMKIKRIKQIEDNEGKTLMSEGVQGSYTDIINYSLFCLILLDEQAQKELLNK